MMNTLTRMTLLLSPAIMMIGGCRNDKAMNASLNAIRTSVSVEFGSYDGSHNTGMKVIDFREAGKAGLIHTDWDADWDVHTGIKKLPGMEKYYLVDIQAVSLSDNPAYQAVGFRLDFHDWSTNNYVLFPAAAYNGNRYKGQPKKRHQGICDATDCGPYMKPFLTDVPRLNISDGPSAIQLISGDMSTPSAGIRFNDLNKGIILLTGQGTDIGDYSYKIEESADRSTAFMTIRMPGIREDSCFMGRRGYPSPDRGRRFAKGDTVHMQFRLLFFDAPAIQSIFDHFINIRKDIGNQHLTERLPYSSAWKLQQKKYNTQNWVAKHGYYSVGMRENPYQDWQTGWTGGMNAVYPLLFNGNDTTRGRVLQTFPFLYDTITPSGFFFGVYYQDSWYDPDHEAFLRRNSDALYFIMKSYSLIKDLYPGRTIPEDWEEAARGAANSYVALFEEYGQFGQWIDNQTGDIIAGTTASNGIA